MDDIMDRGIAEQLDRGDAALILAPSFVGDRRKACTDLLNIGSPAGERVLYVTFTNTPVTLLAEWDDHCGRRPDRAAFVSVDANSRSTVFDNFTSNTDLSNESGITVDQVQSPGNLTKLGIRITNRVEALSEVPENDGITICFDSITALLQYVQVDEAFRFLHVITERFADVGAVSHFHMDPYAHDDETIDTLVTLFDAVYEYEGGEVTRVT